MKVRTLVDELGMTLKTGDLDREITGIYTCDLLSWVISHCKTGDMWITVMNNVNIVAVASLAEIGCIVLPENIDVDNIVIRLAKEKGVTILTSSDTTVDIILKSNKLL